MSLVKNGPEKELRNSSHFGNPQMEPETDTTSAADILTGGGKTQLGTGGGSGATGNTAEGGGAPPPSRVARPADGCDRDGRRGDGPTARGRPSAAHRPT